MNKWFTNLSPVQIIVFGFLTIILTGSLLLTMPFSSADGTATAFIDSLFTATSAVCITGLTTVSTFSHWSAVGKVIIILLIQVGGLGFMTMVTMVFMTLRIRFTYRERNILQESLNLNSKKDLLHFTRYILLFTFSAEAIGAVLLFFSFIGKYSLKQSICYGIFHSVSAFCNAGFDILGDNSLANYSKNFYVSFVVAALIVSGGLGFTVWSELFTTFKKIRKDKFSLSYSFKRLSLHTKLALTTTALLIFSGGVFFFLAEYSNPLTIGGHNVFEKWVAAFFQSVTLRTAGFFSINQGDMCYSSKLVSVLLMAIGGSPAGTAGGIKTVTVSIIVLSVLSVIKGKDSVTAFGRSIEMHTLQKALSVAMLIFAFIVVGTLVLTFTEDTSRWDFMDFLFEVVSAIGTVGLTTGLTPHLTNIGKLVIITGMFLGRLGPITVAIAISTKKRNTENLLHYPPEDIMVG